MKMLSAVTWRSFTQHALPALKAFDDHMKITTALCSACLGRVHAMNRSPALLCSTPTPMHASEVHTALFITAMEGLDRKSQAAV
jgi:hypothetical protein